MDTLLDSLVVAIRADTRDLGRGLRGVREELGGITSFNDIIGDAGELAADRMSQAFERFAQTGKLSFADLKSSILAMLNDIASAVIRSGLQELLGGIFGGGGGGPLGGFLASGSGSGGLGGLLSLAGRAVGGPVREDRPFLVGERGPELFIPSRAGRIEPLAAATPVRPRNINITVNVNGNGDAGALRQSAGQVAVAVRRALLRAERDL
ncbi:MAG: hypothetical protein Tsb0016_27100 [Sphingomonadales bacterium]